MKREVSRLVFPRALILMHRPALGAVRGRHSARCLNIRKNGCTYAYADVTGSACRRGHGWESDNCDAFPVPPREAGHWGKLCVWRVARDGDGRLAS